DEIHQVPRDDALPMSSITGQSAGITPTGAITYTFNGAAAGSGGTSSTEGPLGAGSDTFQASIAADANYVASTSSPEPFTIDQGTLTVTTTLHNATGGATIPLNSHQALGTSAYDTASITDRKSVV